MSTRMGRLGSIMGAVRGAADATKAAPARRYASFVVRGWRPGTTGALVVAHDQSGEHVQADSLVEAIGWIQSQATTQPSQTNALRSDAPGESAQGGEQQAKVNLGGVNLLEVVTA